ncbi:MAG: NAD(P)H-dependent oxidoreductase [Pseudomonadota bacterium]|nr:NAD(P)H-dependent oxidoreductase [Pseudomonadota bacterium]
MPTLLHISASPLHEGSFSSRIADAFLASWRESNPGGTVDTINLWTEQLPAFDAEGATWKLKTMAGVAPSPEDAAVYARIRGVADRFLAADKYLISCPMWNFSVPYTLKHYIDVLVQPGLTYGFDPAKGFFGLVPDRPVQLVLTRGGSYAPGQQLAHLEFQRSYLEGVLGFIGLTDTRAIVMECTGYGPAVSDPLLAQASAEAAVAGQTF